jgi:hypothetical protein
MPGFLIKSFHSPTPDGPKRVHFWQTPWLAKCNPYLTVNEYGESVTVNHREIGGWVTFSGAGTKYPTADEAGNVNALRALGGEVVDADRYLQPRN